eukprot:CAMPEP_0170485848 /NCGR_PEP_ID=MMETSP0208-20121228/5011_1 /TAXON_ID=197538 /ORGANISM="Strombidium inclinatum, Strain S3" /LENGTH=134 /DNA_ID=CAMNT_0010759617 /DNA_START=55 /DNA_END=459 /DNA_ORIENTATION=+
MYQRLPAVLYNGVGPKQSLDQKINFINENNNLARRIIEVGKRKEFLNGLVTDSKQAYHRQRKVAGGNQTTSTMRSLVNSLPSGPPSIISKNSGGGEKFFGSSGGGGTDQLGHRVGSLNLASRKARNNEIIKDNR